MIAAPQHEIKSASAVIEGDVICQSFIQSSSTLAYACLLIRRRRYELASHVLHSLESRQASRFKDMVFYLQAWIGIETGEYGMVKKRLIPRLHRQPNDMVALSLLENCIYREYAGYGPAIDAPQAEEARAESGSPSAAPFGNREAASAAAMASAFGATEIPPPEPEANAWPASAMQPPAAPAAPAMPANASAILVDPMAATSDPFSAGVPSNPFPAFEPAPPSPSASSLAGFPTLPSGIPSVRSDAHPASPAPAASPAIRPAAAPGREGSSGFRTVLHGDSELGLFQGIAQDANTQAIGLWGSGGRARAFCRNPGLEPLMQLLPRELPAALQDACSALDGGPVHKICFSFQHLTATTFHAGSDGMALVTGPLNQSLLVIVRAENTFRKSTGGGSQAGGAPHSGGSSPSPSPRGGAR